MGLWADGSVSMSLQPQSAGRSPRLRTGGSGATGSAGRVRASARTRSGTQAEPEDDTELGEVLARAQRGDSEAFRVLYRDLQPRLLRYLHAMAGQDAEDIASETWLQVTRDLAAFTGTYDGFRGWVATIARHRALDHLRRNQRKPALPVPDDDLAAWPAAGDGADTAQRALDAVATANAIALIATLPPDQAEAVLLRAVLGLDATTAGNVLGKRPGAIRTAASRGLRTLGKKLDKHAREAPLGSAQSGPVTQTRDLALKDVR